MNRRDTVLALLALGAAPLAAEAQPRGKVYRIGVLEITSATLNRVNFNAFLQGLSELGYVEGVNIIIDYRSAYGRAERFPELAADLARARPDIILVSGTPAALAAKGVGTIPVVMTTSADPVGTGIVASLAHPGGNVTGLTTLVSEFGAKRLEILKELVPGIARIAVLYNGSNPAVSAQWPQLERAARSLGLQAQLLDVRDAAGIGRAFNSAIEQRAGAALVSVEAVMSANRHYIVELAAKHRMPVMYAARDFVNAGGLISYGVHYPDMYRRAATFVDKIFKGAKPGDLPIEQPTKLELVINQKAAKALGLTIPRSLLFRADRVIE